MNLNFRKNKNSLATGLLAVGAVAIGLLPAGCSNKSEDPQAQAIKVAYPNWAEGIAMTNLVAHLLETRFEREVELTMADPGLIYASLADGSQDFLLDAWLPTTHASYMEQYGDDLDDLGENFVGAKIGLVAPSYVDVDSITELEANSGEFDGQIIGIGQGAGIMKKTSEALESYGLESFELIPSSGPAMTTALGEAINEEEAIVVTGWEPHWKFARYDLKFLDDPEGVYGTQEVIKTISRTGFEQDNPQVAAFLRQMKMDSQQLGSLMDMIRSAQTGDDKRAAVEKWISGHQELVDSWIPASS